MHKLTKYNIQGKSFNSTELVGGLISKLGEECQNGQLVRVNSARSVGCAHKQEYDLTRINGGPEYSLTIYGKKIAQEVIFKSELEEEKIRRGLKHFFSKHYPK
jgi:hypothetical protein